MLVFMGNLGHSWSTRRQLHASVVGHSDAHPGLPTNKGQVDGWCGEGAEGCGASPGLGSRLGLRKWLGCGGSSGRLVAGWGPQDSTGSGSC